MGYYAVFDFGGSSIKYALMDDKAQFVEKGRVKTPKTNIEDFINLVCSICESYKIGYTLTGIAVSSPGAVNPYTGYVGGSSAIKFLNGSNIKKILEERTGLRVMVENDANCAALAEGWLGSAKNVQNYVCIVIGSGIGGSIIINKKLLRGKNFHAGEVGYMIMEDIFETPLESIWSLKASTKAVIQNVAHLKGIENDLDGKQVFNLGNAGDIIVKNVIEKFYKRLAIGIFNIQYILDPEKILIGGAISERDDVIDNVNIELSKMKNNIAQLDIMVEKCMFSNNANLVGALYNFLYN